MDQIFCEHDFFFISEAEVMPKAIENMWVLAIGESPAMSHHYYTARGVCALGSLPRDGVEGSPS
jgi:hypothetical protein